jgi:hypothetical protein
VFITDRDRENETRAAEAISAAWDCICHRYNDANVIDYWIEKHGRVVCVGELKTRYNSSQTYPTVFLSLRKYWMLRDSLRELGIPAIFFAQFDDGIKWIGVNQITPQYDVTICRRRHHRAENDDEPVIEVPISDMVWLKERAVNGS